MKVQFSQDFRKWMEGARWKPKELAEKLGVQRQSVHNWMEGNSMPKNQEVIYRLYQLGGDSLIIFDNPDDKPRIPKSTHYFQVHGGHALNGELRIPGSKNGALPMLCAALLTEETCTFTDVPEISDIGLLLGIFDQMGAKTSWDKEQKIVEVTAKNIDPTILSESPEIRKFRASILMLGPLLARFGRVEIVQPGGCVIGARPNDVHLNAFEALGATITTSEFSIKCEFEKKSFDQSRVLFPEASVTATENLGMFAAGVEDECELFFTATETHVTQTLKMLESMGAQMSGLGTHRVKIKGKKKLKGGVFKIPPDYLLAGTYAIAGILTGGDLTLKNVYHTELLSFYGMLRRTGASFEFDGDTLRVYGEQNLKAIPKLQTAIFPGFPTDLQSPFGVLLTQCEGESMVFETLFENRLTYLSELEKMGANVRLMNSHQALVTGKTQLKARQVQSWDLRAGAAMVIAGMIADGITTVTNINYIDRGYEHFDMNLRNLGAKVERVSAGI